MDEPDILDSISNGNPENLVFAGTDDLLELADDDEDKVKETILAELTVRWFLSPDAGLEQLLSESLGGAWAGIRAWKENEWGPDRQTGERKIPEVGRWTCQMLPGFEARLHARLNLLFAADGFIPVCDGAGQKGAFIPFKFTKGEVGAFWKDGGRIGGWGDEVCEALEGTDKRGIRLQIAEIQVGGASLMLPVRLAALRGKMLPKYDKLRVFATGKIDAGGRLRDVAVKAKYASLKAQFADAVLFGPDLEGQIPAGEERFFGLDVNEKVNESIRKIGETLRSLPQWRDYIIMTETDAAIGEYYKKFSEQREVQEDLVFYVSLYADKHVWTEPDSSVDGQEGEGTEEPLAVGKDAGKGNDSAGKSDGSKQALHQIFQGKVDIDSCLQGKENAIVSGPSGRGKSSALENHVCQYLASDPTTRPLCVFLPMKRWGENCGVEDFLNSETGGIWEQLEGEGSGRLALAIDAVDECPGGHRVEVIRQIVTFLKKHPRVRFIISTREPKELFDRFIFFRDCRVPELRIRPMDEDHRRNLLGKMDWGRPGLSRNTFLGKIKEQGLPEDIVANPMTLILLAKIYREAPDAPLPKGFAEIYRRITELYYDREKSTQETFREPYEKEGVCMGEKWPEWMTMREKLGALAFKLQNAGAPKGQEADALAFDSSEGEALNRLCTGRVFVCREGGGTSLDNVHFCHKSYQEYFCAEYLAAHPLPAVSAIHMSGNRVDRERWGMPCAYGINLLELDGKTMPLVFWFLACLTNGWMGVALIPHGWKFDCTGYPKGTKDNCIQLLRRYCAFPVFEKAISDELTKDDILLSLRDGSWYSREDEALRHVVRHTAVGYENWKRMEESQLSQLDGLWRNNAVKLAKSWLVLEPRAAFREHAREKWNRWVEDATPQTALELNEAGIAEREDFKKKIPLWIAKASLYDACLLTEKEWAPKSAFAGLLPKWAAVATPDMACRMIKCGLACADDFSGRFDDWLKHPQFSFVQEFLSQYAPREMRQRAVGRLDDWIATASLRSASCLASWLAADGQDLPETFKAKIPQWVAGARLREQLDWTAVETLDSETARKLIQLSETIKAASAQIKAGKKTPAEFAADKPRWIADANIELACEMIDAGLASKEDFWAKMTEWRSSATPEAALALHQRSRKYSGSRMYSDTRRFWWNDCSARDAAWKSSLTPHQAYVLRTPSDGMKERWLRDKTPDTLWALVQSGCLSWGEAAEFCALWGAEFVPPGPFRTVMELLSKRGRMLDGHVVLKGHVESVCSTSASFSWFVDDGRVSGRLRQTNASWYPWQPVTDVVSVGQDIDLVLITAEIFRSLESGRFGAIEIFLHLGIRQLQENPWGAIAERYPKGRHLRGKVISLWRGASVRLEDGAVGEIPDEEIVWSRPLNADQTLKKGEDVEVVVAAVDTEERRIQLSLAEFQRLRNEYTPGVHVRGAVEAVKEYYMFVRLEKGGVGFVHRSEYSWTVPVSWNVGDRVEAVVMDPAPNKTAITLSIRQLFPDPWKEIPLKYSVGTLVHGKIIRLPHTGAVVQLEDGIEGFIGISEISDDTIGDICDVLHVSQIVEARVIVMDPVNHRIGLSIKAVRMDQVRFEAKYRWCLSYHVGQMAKGTVVGMDRDGMIRIKLKGGVIGALLQERGHSGETDGGTVPNAGDEIKVRIQAIDEAKRTILLSSR